MKIKNKNNLRNNEGNIIIKFAYDPVSLNQIIKESRSSYRGANARKKEREHVIGVELDKIIRGVGFEKPVYVKFIWFLKKMKCDPDNVASAGMKNIFDTLKNKGHLISDGAKYIKGFAHDFQYGDGNFVQMEFIEDNFKKKMTWELVECKDENNIIWEGVN